MKQSWEIETSLKIRNLWILIINAEDTFEGKGNWDDWWVPFGCLREKTIEMTRN